MNRVDPNGLRACDASMQFSELSGEQIWHPAAPGNRDASVVERIAGCVTNLEYAYGLSLDVHGDACAGYWIGSLALEASERRECDSGGKVQLAELGCRAAGSSPGGEGLYWNGESCGYDTVEVHCRRFSNFITDQVCAHREGIIKVGGYAILFVSLAVPGTAGVILVVTAGGAVVAAETLDNKPCKVQRVALAAVLGTFGSAVGGLFAEGGLPVGNIILTGGSATTELATVTC